MDLRQSNLLFGMLLLCLLFSILVVPIAALDSKASLNPVTIDGKWTTANEWTDAAEFKFPDGIFCIKNDDKFLYVLIDYVWDTTLDQQDSGRIRIDVKNDKADAPQADDFLIRLDWVGGNLVRHIDQGDGTKWISHEGDLPWVKAASTRDPENDPNSKTSHLIYEFSVFTRAPIFGGRREIGFYAVAGHRFNLEGGRYLNIVEESGGDFRRPSKWPNLLLATPLEKSTTTTSITTTTTTPTPTPASSTQSETPSPSLTTITTTVSQPMGLDINILTLSAAIIIAAVIVAVATMKKRKKS